MSDKLENQIFIKINGNFHKKNRKYIKENLIRYDENKFDDICEYEKWLCGV